jgi:hypothetical protein
LWQNSRLVWFIQATTRRKHLVKVTAELVFGGRRNKGISMKLVINRCYGGFGLSGAAVALYAERKGFILYPETKGSLNLTTYWKVPPEQRVKDYENWYGLTVEERQAYNKAYTEQTLNEREIPRDDADLVFVVEALGDLASGDCAKLGIVEVPDGVAWEISEYDGFERVEEAHRSWS